MFTQFSVSLFQIGATIDGVFMLKLQVETQWAFVYIMLWVCLCQSQTERWIWTDFKRSNPHWRLQKCVFAVAGNDWFKPCCLSNAAREFFSHVSKCIEICLLCHLSGYQYINTLGINSAVQYAFFCLTFRDQFIRLWNSTAAVSCGMKVWEWEQKNLKTKLDLICA